MNYYQVSMVGRVGTYCDALTYQSPDKWPIGTIVSIPVGQKSATGVIVKKVNKPTFLCKNISHSIIDHPLPISLINLQYWLSEYYAASSGLTWQTILPARLTMKPRLPKLAAPTCLPNRTHNLLNEAQRQAVEQIRQTSSGTILLHGITGSGKTEVYKTIAQDTLASGRSVIVLTPEISLTTQLVNDFRCQFANVVVAHSAMTASERNRVWRYILFNEQPIIVIGPRSALFAPIDNLGLIIIDECHEPSYKQESTPRYNAITTAAKLCQLTNGRLILGSATPSISDYYLTKHFRRPIIKLDQLAVHQATKPTTKIVDLTKSDNFNLSSRLFTTPLLTAIQQALNHQRQVLLFHNRRGTASLAICQDCGWLASCPNCHIPLTLHGDKFQLVCHTCGYRCQPPLVCPDCRQANMVYKGIGTKLIEQEVSTLFPTATVRRFDGDTAKGEAVQDVYDELRDGQTDIIIGTQIIAKGLNLPKLAVVGIVQADAGLALPDFAASERTFQLITQACGRVGRTSDATTAIIQTYQPQSPAVTYGASQNYLAFYQNEISQRRCNHFPPFTYLLKLSCAYKTEQGAINASKRLADQLRHRYANDTKLLGPAPAFYERLRGQYHWQIIIRASHRSTLIKIAQEITLANWQAELDPLSLI